MERFSKLLSASYLFTQSIQEIPDYLLNKLETYVQFAPQREQLVACCWIKNFLSKGEIFLLITDKRVVYRDPSRTEQHLFVNITGVEQDMLKNIQLLSTGHSTKIFGQTSLPSKKLLNRLFALINNRWLEVHS